MKKKEFYHRLAQVEYLEQVNHRFEALRLAFIRFNEIWQKDSDHGLDLNDHLTTMYPFPTSFDEFLVDFALWYGDGASKIVRAKREIQPRLSIKEINELSDEVDEPEAEYHILKAVITETSTLEVYINVPKNIPTDYLNDLITEAEINWDAFEKDCDRTMTNDVISEEPTKENRLFEYKEFFDRYFPNVEEDEAEYKIDAIQWENIAEKRMAEIRRLREIISTRHGFEASFIKDVGTEQTGGGVMVDFVTFKNLPYVIGLTEDSVCVYKNMEHFCGNEEGIIGQIGFPDEIAEMCPKCETEVYLVPLFQIQPCPNCGCAIKPCAQCEGLKKSVNYVPCDACPLDKDIVEEQRGDYSSPQTSMFTIEQMKGTGQMNILDQINQVEDIRKRLRVDRAVLWTDGQHSWLQAKYSELVLLDVHLIISKYSYRNGDDVYLEEDCDAVKYIKAIFGQEPKQDPLYELWVSQVREEYKEKIFTRKLKHYYR